VDAAGDVGEAVLAEQTVEAPRSTAGSAAASGTPAAAIILHDPHARRWHLCPLGPGGRIDRSLTCCFTREVWWQMLAPAGQQALCPSADGRLVDMSRKKLAKDSRRGLRLNGGRYGSNETTGSSTSKRPLSRAGLGRKLPSGSLRVCRVR
jgi:hypothetical protein